MSDDYVIIGIDPSARKLAAVVTWGDDFEIVKRTMPTDVVQRSVVAYRWVRMLIRSAPAPVAIFIEEPVFGKGGASGTLPLAKVHGAMLAAASIAGAAVVMPVSNSSWKSRIVGRIPRGSNHKAYVKSWARKYWRNLYDEADGDQDVCDAAAINRYGKEIMRLRKLITHERVDVARDHRRLVRKSLARR